MKKITHSIVMRLGVLAAGALVSGACLDSEDVAELGIYHGHGARRDAGERDSAPDPAAPDGADASAGAPPACARTSCISSEAPATADPALHCHALVVSAGMSPPLPPDSLPDRFVNFELPAPIEGQEYLRSIAPIVDDVRVLHHLKLYESKRAPVGPGEPPAPRRLLYSWAPGMGGLFLDPSMGIAVAPDTNYTLEIHYVGAAERVFDGSGFEVCFTPTAPEHLVSFSSLIAEGLPTRPATGTCSPQQAHPILLLAVQPNLDSQGRQVTLVLDRQGDGEELLLDEPYDHEFLPHYALNAQLRRGDTLRTRCDYVPPPASVPLSGASCELQVLHWPAHTLVDGPAAGSAFERCGP